MRQVVSDPRGGAEGARVRPAVPPYPNRSLGLAYARSDESAAYDDQAWACIAAANMRTGDRFTMYREPLVVESITKKTLKIRSAAGVVQTLPLDGKRWPQFLRDLSGQIVTENLSAKSILKPPPARPLLEILMRDPTVHFDTNGSVFLRDTAPFQNGIGSGQ